AAALLGALPWPEPDRTGLAFLVLAALFVLWNGASIAWSLDPDRSWAYTNRGLAYLAFACVGLFVGAIVPRAPRAVAGAFAVFLAGVLGWALLGKVVPSLFPDGGRLARLRSPVGYWNALALLADMAVALGLWLAARREHRHAVRIAGAVLLYAAVVSILLAYSRAGVLVAIAVGAAWLAVRPERLESLVACGLAGGAGGWLRARAHEFTSQANVKESPGRVTSFSSNHRWAWWKESWSAFLEHPLDGTGAGSFVLVHRPRRSTSLDVTTEPHNVPLQFLGETGIVGFLLFVGAAVAAALGMRAT